MTLASATSWRARRRVSWPSNSWWTSRWRSPQLPHANRRRSHSNVVARPDTGRSRTLRRRRSCTVQHLNPHCGQRDQRRVDATSTMSWSVVSTTTASTRMRRRCSRTRIESGAIEASWIGDVRHHRFQRGLDPYTGTLNPPSPHDPAQRRLLSASDSRRAGTGSIGTVPSPSQAVSGRRDRQPMAQRRGAGVTSAMWSCGLDLVSL